MQENSTEVYNAMKTTIDYLREEHEKVKFIEEQRNAVIEYLESKLISIAYREKHGITDIHRKDSQIN